MSIQVPSPAYGWTSGASTRPAAGSAPTSASADKAAATPRRDGTRAMSRRYRVRRSVAHNRRMAAEEELPAWSLPADAVERITLPTEWPERVTREWAWGGSSGKGVRVCILDSGVEPNHPMVGDIERAVAIKRGEDQETIVEEDTEGDLCGHGTGCAGIVHSLAPEASLTSVRVLGAGFKGSGYVLLAGLRWAVEQGFDVINMSLSTTKQEITSLLH